MEDFQVKHPEVEKALKDIGHTLAEQMPEGYGFSLLIFSYGEGGSMFYMSNAQRPDMIKAMKEFINREENKS